MASSPAKVPSAEREPKANLDAHEKLDRDKPTWRQYVIPDNFESAFAKEYNITAIPRFMVFDGEGRIITINAERPSAPNIVQVIDGYLE